MKQIIKKYILPVILLTALLQISCFDLYNEMLASSGERYRLSIVETSTSSARLLNLDPEGNITAASWNITGPSFNKSVFADFNKDGNIDILTMKEDIQNPVISYSDGKGNFVNTAILPALGGGIVFADLTVADFDNNGYPDVVVGTMPGQGSRYYLNNYPSGFSGTVTPPFADTSGAHTGITAADFDGDGDKDLFIGSDNVPSQVWINDFNTGGSFTNRALWTPSPQTFPIRDAVSGDIDNDGDIDVIEVGTGAPFIKIWINAGNGYFAPGLSLTLTTLNSIKLADFDRDGDLDAYAGNMASTTNYFLINDGNGQFTSITHIAPNITNSIAIGDVDLDGDIDIILCCSISLYVYKNNGSAQFTLTNSYPSPGGSTISIGAIYQ